jgi:excisionase family DNA binding protein
MNRSRSCGGEPVTEPQLLLKVEQAAEKLGIGRTTTYQLIQSGALPSVKIGRRRLVPATAPDEYVSKLLPSDEEGSVG